MKLVPKSGGNNMKGQAFFNRRTPATSFLRVNPDLLKGEGVRPVDWQWGVNEVRP
jgi:hypothetical protein